VQLCGLVIRLWRPVIVVAGSYGDCITSWVSSVFVVWEARCAGAVWVERCCLRVVLVLSGTRGAQVFSETQSGISSWFWRCLGHAWRRCCWDTMYWEQFLLFASRLMGWVTCHLSFFFVGLCCK
jgi:hypothetical protein